jgi:hypothetical protein
MSDKKCKSDKKVINKDKRYFCLKCKQTSNKTSRLCKAEKQPK